MKSTLLLMFSIFTFALGCQQGDAGFEKLRDTHCDATLETQKIVVEKFDKALKIFEEVDLNAPTDGRDDQNTCDQAAKQLELAIRSTDKHKNSALSAGKARPKGMVLSQSGITLNNSSATIREFVTTIKGCKNVGELKSAIPWVQASLKVELAGEHKACRSAADRK